MIAEFNFEKSGDYEYVVNVGNLSEGTYNAFVLFKNPTELKHLVTVDRNDWACFGHVWFWEMLEIYVVSRMRGFPKTKMFFSNLKLFSNEITFFTRSSEDLIPLKLHVVLHNNPQCVDYQPLTGSAVRFNYNGIGDSRFTNFCFSGDSSISEFIICNAYSSTKKCFKMPLTRIRLYDPDTKRPLRHTLIQLDSDFFVISMNLLVKTAQDLKKRFFQQYEFIPRNTGRMELAVNVHSECRVFVFAMGFR